MIDSQKLEVANNVLSLMKQDIWKQLPANAKGNSLKSMQFQCGLFCGNSISSSSNSSSISLSLRSIFCWIPTLSQRTS